MDNSKPIYSSEKLLVEEFNQAWSHYRHLENGRNAYFSFLFTILTASAAFATVVLKDDLTQRQDLFGLIIASYIWLCLLNIVALIVFAITIKARCLLDHYEGVWNSIRAKFYNDVPDVINELDFRKQFYPVMERNLFSQHKTAQYLLYLIFVSLDVLGLWLTYELFVIPSYVGASIISLIQVVICLLQGYVIIAACFDRWYMINSGKKPVLHDKD